MSKRCSEFLDAFCNEFPSKLNEDSTSVPFDIARRQLTKVEIEGQCIDWMLSFLSKRDCPSYLASILAREAVNKTLLTLKNDTSHESSQDIVSSELLTKVTFRHLNDVCHSFDHHLLSVCNHLVDPEMHVHAIKNTRRKMEDKHVVLPYFGLLFNNSYKWMSYYAVFDGHGGVDAAQYAATHLHCILSHHLQSCSNATEALKQSFIDTDRMFVEHANQERLTSGSTAVCVLVDRDLLHIAWLGDSQALLIRDGKSVPLMSPHKPEREDERKRIEDLGGCVMFIGTWRVNGTLSVSRAIGDASSKPFISGEPDVTTASYVPGDWLILACDGLWDQLTYDEVAVCVCGTEDNSSSVAQCLVRLAKERGSSDNITVVAVRLGKTTSDPDRLSTSLKSNETSDKHDEFRHRDDDNDRGDRYNAGDDMSHRAVGDQSNTSPLDRVNSSNENSRLCLSVKRSADRSLDDSDIEDGDRGVGSDDSQRNTFDMSRLASLSDVVVVTTVMPRSDPPSVTSSSWTTTSDDISKKSSQDTTSAETEHFLLQLRRRSSRRRPSLMSMMKENRAPSSDVDAPAGATPPCLPHISPPPPKFDDPAPAVLLPSQKSCRSLSWVSLGPLNALPQRSSQHSVSAIKSPVETRGGRLQAVGNTSSSHRWTIAVEVEADVEMFNSDMADIATMKMPAAMNTSTHW